MSILTSRPPLKQTVLGVFDFAKIIAGGPKNKLLDWFYVKFAAKSIFKKRIFSFCQKSGLKSLSY